MRHFRKALLTGLVLGAVVFATVVSTGIATASSVPRPDFTAPATQPAAPPNPHNGEPDSGSTRNQAAGPNASRTISGVNAQYAIDVLRTLRLTGLVWARHFLGLGD